MRWVKWGGTGEAYGSVRGLLRLGVLSQSGSVYGAYADLGEGKLDSVSALSPEQPTLLILPDPRLE